MVWSGTGMATSLHSSLAWTRAVSPSSCSEGCARGHSRAEQMYVSVRAAPSNSGAAISNDFLGQKVLGSSRAETPGFAAASGRCQEGALERGDHLVVSKYKAEDHGFLAFLSKFHKQAPKVAKPMTLPFERPVVELEGKIKEPAAVKELQKCAFCLAVAAAVALPGGSEALASVLGGSSGPNPAYPDVAVLIAGQPVKEPNALLRYALPISNKPIRDVQFPLELITEDLRVPGTKALDSVERNVRQAARVLNQNKDKILADVAEGKKDDAKELVAKLSDGLQDFMKICEAKDRPAVVPKQKELLAYVGDIQEDMVAAFPFSIPEEFAGKPVLMGRARVEMKVRLLNNPTLKSATLDMVIDGYNAPVTGGNFLDLVERRFYDGMEIQRADGFVVQTGDPEGPSEGFVDPNTGDIRTVPLEIMVDGDKEPIYHETLEELGRYKAIPRLPFNAFGTLAMAREEFSNDSASSQIFWLLKESELTPSNANILDGRYSVFGYIVRNQDLLADLKVGDVIESMRVVQGLDNLVNPSYK